MVIQNMLLKCRDQLLFLSMVLTYFSSPELKAQNSVYINPEKIIIEDFEGWGTSMAWWAEDAGDYHENDEEVIDRLSEVLINDLNFTTFRYNIGGSCDEDDESDCERLNTGMNPQRTIPNMNEPDRGLNQRRMLKSLAKIGEQNGLPMTFETFSNSPPYWMLKSGSPSGGRGGSNNLKDDQYDDFAEYLVRATGYINDDLEPYGFRVESIEPFNEPLAGWWRYDDGSSEWGVQEGCSFSLENQYKMINALYEEMEGQDATAFIAANDNFRMNPAVVDFYQEKGLTDKLERLNFHDYAGSVADRKQLRNMATALDKKLWISEGGLIGLSENGGAYMFQLRFMDRICKDLKFLRPDRWLDWQTMDTHSSWTAIDYYEYMNNGNIEPNKRFYMMQHFTKHFNIDDEELFSSSDVLNVTAFRSADETQLSIVVVNLADRSEAYDIDLSDFEGVSNTSVDYWLTDNDANNHSQQSNISVNGSGHLNISMPSRSIATFVLPISGGTSSCSTTLLSSYYNVEGQGWSSGTSITVDAGQTIVLGPQPDSGGDWEWSGLGTSGTSREHTITPITSGRATAVFTNNCGETSELNVDVLVNDVDCSATIIRPNILANGNWSQETSVVVSSGSLVRIHPHPTEGGTWSWSGCGVPDSYTSREMILYPESTCTITATYTNSCGTQSSLDFEIGVLLQDGVYQIRNRRSGKCLTNSGGSSTNGTSVVQLTCDDREDQQWQIVDEESGTYSIAHVPSGLYFDIAGASTQAGARNILWSDNGGDNQRWNLEPNGRFYHILNINSGLILDIDGGSRSDNAQSIQWPDNGGRNQDWTFLPVTSQSSSSRMATASNLEVDVAEGQSWSVYPNPVSDGYLNIYVTEDLVGSQVTVYGFSGREYLRYTVLEHEQQLDVTGLEAGVYFISLNGANQEVRKLLVR